MVVIVFIPGPQEAEADPYLKTRDQFCLLSKFPASQS